MYDKENVEKEKIKDRLYTINQQEMKRILKFLY